MAVSLPTAADVRKVREQAAKTAADRVEAARAPLMAVLGAGEQAVTTVNKLIADARARAETAQKRFADLPTEVEDLRARLTAEEIRKTVEEWRAQATKYYEGLAERGEATWAEIRKQPRVQQALDAFESYAEKLDAQVEEFVDEAHDAAEKALGMAAGRTRATAQKSAESVKEAADKAAESAEKAEPTDNAGGKTGGQTKAVAKPTEKAVAEVAEKAPAKPAEPAEAAEAPASGAAGRSGPKTANRGSAARRTRGEDTASS